MSKEIEEQLKIARKVLLSIDPWTGNYGSCQWCGVERRDVRPADNTWYDIYNAHKTDCQYLLALGEDAAKIYPQPSPVCGTCKSRGIHDWKCPLRIKGESYLPFSADSSVKREQEEKYAQQDSGVLSLPTG